MNLPNESIRKLMTSITRGISLRDRPYYNLTTKTNQDLQQYKSRVSLL